MSGSNLPAAPAGSGSIPDLASLDQFNVNRSGQIEGIGASLYHYQAYAAAGQNQLTFFQTPAGQGGLTKADTNMEGAGFLPSPKRFLVQGIEIYYWPGSVPSPAQGAVVANNINDAYKVMQTGWLDFYIGSKSYLTEAPISRMPPSTGLSGIEAIAAATTGAAAAGTVNVVDYARFGGSPYRLNPPILLVPTQNFNVTLNWPALVTTAVAGKIGIVLKGILYRNSQ